MSYFAERGLGHLCLWIWAVVTIYTQWNTWSLDASALYFSAYFYDLGQWDLVYSPKPHFFWNENYPREWIALARSQTMIEGNFAPFVYPPLWAALLAPLASNLNVIQFFNLVNLLNAAATVGAVYISFGLLRPQRASFTIWSLVTVVLLQFTVIGLLAIELGQPQVFVTFLILAAFKALLSKRNTLAGGLLAFAAAIKIAPGFLAIVFIMERRWPALWAFLFASAAFAGLGLLLAGPDLHRELLIRLRDLETQVLISRVNLTLDSILLQVANWLGDMPAFSFFQYRIEPKPDWVFWLSKLILIIGLVITYFSTRHLPSNPRIWFRLHLTFLILFITGPLAWTHYLILTILLLPGLIGQSNQRFSTLFLLSFGLVFSTEGYWILYPMGFGGNIQLFSGFIMVLAIISVHLYFAMRKRTW